MKPFSKYGYFKFCRGREAAIKLVRKIMWYVPEDSGKERHLLQRCETGSENTGDLRVGLIQLPSTLRLTSGSRIEFREELVELRKQMLSEDSQNISMQKV